MKIVESQYYKTRNGQKAGPMVMNDSAGWDGKVGHLIRSWHPNGLHLMDDRDLDLVAEWDGGPVRTVTRKEVVPGVYGAVRVYSASDMRARVYIGHSEFREPLSLEPDELRAAAATLTEIADALGEAE
jgi:hypothetical protein